MSSQIFPLLPGIGFDVVRSYQWKTAVQEALSGKQAAVSMRSYPLVHWELTCEVMRHNLLPSELLQIMGLYNALQGRGDTFLYTDPDFNTITPAQASQYGVFGTGDGSTLTFQLVALWQNSGGPGGAELIQNLNATPILYDNGTTISSANYSIGSTGTVTFGAGHAPAAGHTLTWSGSWYYRCRFDEDAIVWTKFMAQFWKAKFAFTSIKL